MEVDNVGLIARGPGVGVMERSRSNLAMAGGDTRVGVGDLARAVALLVPDTEVGATLEARRLPGVGVEGGGGRFIGVTDLAAAEDDGGDEEDSGRFEVDAEVRAGRLLAAADAGETLGERVFAGEDVEEGIIRDGEVGGLAPTGDVGVVKLDRLRAVMVPVSVLVDAKVVPSL